MNTNTMTAAEFEQVRNGGGDTESPTPHSTVPSIEDSTPDMSDRDFIIGRSKESVTVNVGGPGGTRGIVIKKMLNVREAIEHKNFLVLLDNVAAIDDLFLYTMAAPFLATITLDPELDEEFWLSDDLDPYIIQKLIAVFIGKNHK